MVSPFKPIPQNTNAFPMASNNLCGAFPFGKEMSTAPPVFMPTSTFVFAPTPVHPATVQTQM